MSDLAKLLRWIAGWAAGLLFSSVDPVLSRSTLRFNQAWHRSLQGRPLTWISRASAGIPINNGATEAIEHALIARLPIMYAARER